MRARSILLGLAMVGVLLSSAGSLGGCHARVYPNRIYAHRPYRHHYYRPYRYSPPVPALLPLLRSAVLSPLLAAR